MHLHVDTLLQGGKYRIVRFISSGGFGCTYEAEHMMFRKRVAIKEFFVKDFCGRDERTACVTIEATNKRDLVDKLKRKFVDEARSIFDLHHPGIVRVTDVFEENDTAYYVMDYIEGKSLKEIVDDEGALSEMRALEYIRQIAEALEYVHAHNRLHLDIKPGNIMIDSNGRAVLIDFGASKQYDEVNGENTSTLLGQTPGYAPPEQEGNDLVKFTPATDIYALGATLYKLLTAVTPLSSHRRISGEELSPLPKRISKSTCKAIEKAMKLNRNERIKDITEFRNVINRENLDGWYKIGRLVAKSKPVLKKIIIWTVIVGVAWGGYEWLYWEVYYPNYILPDESKTEDKEEIVYEIESPVVDDESKSVEETTSGFINGHEYVDLGLSVKWATMNVGATSPDDNGNYFAWGETLKKTKFVKINSVTYNKEMIDDISGDRVFDAAKYEWGGSWRLPSAGECKELVKKCEWSWTVKDGCEGYRVIGPNGKSIFLPAAGYIQDGELLQALNKMGIYWTGSPYGSWAQVLSFDQTIYRQRSREYRYIGATIRPVSD